MRLLGGLSLAVLPARSENYLDGIISTNRGLGLCLVRVGRSRSGDAGGARTSGCDRGFVPIRAGPGLVDHRHQHAARLLRAAVRRNPLSIRCWIRPAAAGDCRRARNRCGSHRHDHPYDPNGSGGPDARPERCAADRGPQGCGHDRQIRVAHPRRRERDPRRHAPWRGPRAMASPVPEVVTW